MAPDGDAIKYAWTSIIGGRMMLITEGGSFFYGSGTVGTELTYATDEGDYRLVVNDAVLYADGEYKGGPLYHYDLHYEVKGDDGWTGDTTPLCNDGEGNPTEALFLPGEWDQETGDRLSYSATSLTAACRQGALAKCAEWGYRPGIMPNTHATCLRMVRADYEGVGEPYTVNGTLIFVGDELGINTQEQHGSATIREAEWGPDGALCIERHNLRHRELTPCDGAQGVLTCWPSIDDCSDTSLDILNQGAILTAVPRPWVSELTVGIAWRNPSDVQGVKERDLGVGSAAGANSALTAQEDLDGLVRHATYGLRGFVNDLVGGGTRMVGVWTNGDLDSIGSTIPGRHFHGAATIAEDSGQTIYALDDVNDQLCTVAMLTGALLGCADIVDALDGPFDVSMMSDLTADNAEGSSFTFVNGTTTLYTLTRNGSTWRAVASGTSPNALNGIAHALDGTTVGISFGNNNLIDVDTGVKIANAGDGGSLGVADLAGLPIGAPGVPLGQGPEGVVDGVCAADESPAARDCDGVCDAADELGSPDCGNRGFCNQFDGRMITVQNLDNARYLSASPDTVGVIATTTADDDERWSVRCLVDDFDRVVLTSHYGKYLKGNNSGDALQKGGNIGNYKRWRLRREPGDTWAIKNYNTHGQLRITSVFDVSMGGSMTDNARFIIRDDDLGRFCDDFAGEEVTLQGSASSRYLRGGAEESVDSAASVEAAARWKVVCANAHVRLRNASSDGFLTALSGGAGAVLGQSAAAGPTERWLPVRKDDGTWSFQSKPRRTFAGIDGISGDAQQGDTNGGDESFVVAVD